MIHFNLVPHTRDVSIDIRGAISMTGRTIYLSYKLDGDLALLEWPVHSRSPKRELNLWQATCFEMFISNPCEPAYHEFNLSPSGNWHSFSFPDYRADMATSIRMRST